MQTAYFNRFTLDIPDEAVDACAHSGECAADVEAWAPEIARPSACTVEALARELRECGAWDEDELADDEANWHRIIWIACCDLREEARMREIEYLEDAEDELAKPEEQSPTGQ